MDETGPATTHPQAGSTLAEQQHLSKEGWLIKLSGYLVKLAYYRSPQDDVPRRIIELGGCVVEPTEDGSVLLLERRVGKPQPHRYVIRSNDPEVMNEWTESIKRASMLYEEIFYASITRTRGRELEHCFPHWSDQYNVFRNLTKDALHHRKESGGHEVRQVYDNHKLYKVCSLVSHASAPIFVCVVEKRLVSSKPEAFLQDLRHRFEREVGEDSSPSADDAMERLLGKMMRVYSPGYEADPEDPQLVANAAEWLRRFA